MFFEPFPPITNTTREAEVPVSYNRTFKGVFLYSYPYFGDVVCYTGEPHLVRIPPVLKIKLSSFLPLITVVSDQTELLLIVCQHAAPPDRKLTPHPKRESTYLKSQLPLTEVHPSQQLRSYRTLTREATEGVLRRKRRHFLWCILRSSSHSVNDDTLLRTYP